MTRSIDAMSPFGKPRHVAWSMRMLDNPEAVSSWIILDAGTDVPVASDGLIRTCLKAEMQGELERLNVRSGSLGFEERDPR